MIDLTKNVNSSGCNCNKPVYTPCQQSTQPTQSKKYEINLDNNFKVNNLFNELRSEWQRVAARNNLGITDIIDLKQTRYGESSLDPNVWELTLFKDGNTFTRNLVVRNGEKGESATIEVGTVQQVDYNSPLRIKNSGTNSHVVLNFEIPKGQPGKDGSDGKDGTDGTNGDQGLSAYDLYKQNGGNLELSEWLSSLKGKDGEDSTIDRIYISSVENTTKTYLDNQSITCQMFIWKVKLSDGTEKEFWVPKSVQSESSSYSVFLYKSKTFDSQDEAYTFLGNLQSNVNINPDQGHPVNYLINTLGFSKYSPVTSGDDYVFMAQTVITNGQVGPWSVVIVSYPKPEDIIPQNGKQGLAGPVIRLRYLNDESDLSTNCYVNESQKVPETETDLRYIDVVIYDVNGQISYWMPKPSDGCATTLPNPNDWIEADGLEFSYINTLIAQQLAAKTIDTDEVRIHSNLENVEEDKIVAGMTSGKPVDGTPIVYTQDNNEVRIWAGTEASVLDDSMDISTAPFRVCQDGKLYAQKAYVEGTVQADILRLGSNSFISGNNEVTSRLLPKLENNKVQMFYILTDEMNTNSRFTITPSAGDKIKYLNLSTQQFETTSGDVYLKPDRLYQAFGIDHNSGSSSSNHNLIWHLVEQNLAPITTKGTPVGEAMYELSYYIVIHDTCTGSNIESGTLQPKAEVFFYFLNNLDSPVSVTIPAIQTSVVYDEGSYSESESNDREETPQIELSLYDSKNPAYAWNIPQIYFTAGVGETKTGYGVYNWESNPPQNAFTIEMDKEDISDLAGYFSNFKPVEVKESWAELEFMNKLRIIRIKKTVASVVTA